MLLPLIIGMAVALAAVAVVFAWRGGAAVGAVSQFVSRRLTGIRHPGRAGDDTVRHPPAPINLAQTEAALALQPLAGGRSFCPAARRTGGLGRGRARQVA